MPEPLQQATSARIDALEERRSATVDPGGLRAIGKASTLRQLTESFQLLLDGEKFPRIDGCRAPLL